ncbi:MAG TPA: folate-binding protein [Xanthobacteraceae bacterium]|jgi:folate-binding protein YgfZ|nr:folate-binding protein [Xanthobacteraceae bacterium]
MKAALLPDRGVIKVAGDAARNFLHGLVTADILTLAPVTARFSALLTPQGKIIADFFVIEGSAAQGGGLGDGFFLDVPGALTATLVERLNLYRLRAKITIEDMSAKLAVLAAWDDNAKDGGIGHDAARAIKLGLGYADPRLPALGLRAIVPAERAAEAAAEVSASVVAASDYEAHRIALGVPSGGVDFAYSDAFPHETDMDQLGGVDFKKGCFIGQEVVSRMQHRGTARTRAVPVRFEGAAPDAGTAITAGGRPVGTLGSTGGGRGIALLRLDRVDEALAEGGTLTAGSVPLHLVKPDWARFPFPGEKGGE